MNSVDKGVYFVVRMKQIIFLFLLLLSFPNLTAQSYDFISYGLEEGLSQSEPRCIQQDSRGMLWVGTTGGGVCSFDGLKFREYGPKDGLPGKIINCIAEDSIGNMWFGTSDAGAVMFDVKVFTVIDVKQGLVDNDIRAIVATKNGVIICVRSGFYEYNSATRKILKFISINNLTAVCIDRNGIIWVGCDDGLVRLINGEKTTIDLNLSSEGKKSVTCLKLTQGGELYIGLSTGILIYKLSTGIFLNTILTSTLSTFQINNLYLDHLEALWVSTNNNSVFKYSKDQQFVVFNSGNGLTAEIVYCITEDNSHHIWLCTRERSLLKLRSETFSYFDSFQGLNSAAVFSIIEDFKHRIWTGSSLDGLNVFDGKSSKTILNGNLSFNKPVALLEDPKKRIWVGHLDGVSCIVNDHVVNSILKGVRVRSLMYDRKGMLWIGTWGQGIYKYNPDVKGGTDFEKLTFENKMLPNNYVHAIHEAKNGQIYVGTGAGLAVYNFNPKKGQEFRFYGTLDGLCNTYVGSIVEDDFGKIWFHTDACIMRFDPKVNSSSKFKSYTEENGLASNTFYLLAFDSFGNLWVGSNKGVDKIKLGINGEFSAVKNYSRNEGFRGIECNSRAVYVASDKSIWFGTVKGVIRYNPSKDFQNTTAPIINISGVSLFLEQTDWKYFGAKEIGWYHLPDSLKLDNEHNHLTFYYAGVHLQSPRSTHYQFMLVGFDSTWQHESDATQFTYTNLSAGKYIFKVRARIVPGDWGEQIAVSCPITILPPPPPIWTTWWFICIVILVIILLIIFIIVGRTNRIFRQKIVLENEVRERTIEISKQNKEKTLLLKEIHHRVKNNLQVISSLLNLQADGITDDRVLSLFEDCKHRVNAMALLHEKMYQSKNLSNIDIRNYIDDLIRSLIAAYDTKKAIHLHANIEEHPFHIDTIVPMGLILNEIISNSLKYAFTDRMEGDLYISLKKMIDNHFILEVSDNGKGIPSAINFDKAESLGMQLIQMLSGQINGKASLLNDHGACYRIEFRDVVKDRF